MSFNGRKNTTLCLVEVVRTERISPNFVRVTVGGPSLAAMTKHGYDHWFRLFLPQEDGETSFDLPKRVDTRGYLQYLRMPAETRPPMRNYTVREFRPDALELDIDFVVHGDEGLATRFATRAKPGDTLALLDQGAGFEFDPAVGHYLLAADETGLPAVAGILRDLPRDARGAAVIEVPHSDDVQELSPPEGVAVEWIVRGEHARPGALALEAVKRWAKPAEPTTGYLVGEQALATGARRWLVNELGVAKKSIVFSGYWKIGVSN